MADLGSDDESERSESPESIDSPSSAKRPSAHLEGEGIGQVDEGGDAACWAHLICEECGAFLDGSPHRVGCSCGDDFDKSTA